MTFYTPPAVLSALGLTTYEPAAGSGSFLINPPFAMTELPPNTICHTVYADRTIDLTVTAWPSQEISGAWSVHFHRRGAQRWDPLRAIAYWRSSIGWDTNSYWHPVGAPQVPPAALAAVGVAG
jgi:hypothetical protein